MVGIFALVLIWALGSLPARKIEMTISHGMEVAELFAETFQVLPEFRMLFDQLLFTHR